MLAVQIFEPLVEVSCGSHFFTLAIWPIFILLISQAEHIQYQNLHTVI
jgi:hypothetical protein